jgi:hypothetical protein
MTSMSESISRRDALKKLALLMGAAGAVEGGRQARAAELPHLKPNDPTAVALSYTDNAAGVDSKKFPSYQPGQHCGTCLQLQGQDGQPWRPCNLFPGMLVNANGWCKVWVPKA